MTVALIAIGVLVAVLVAILLVLPFIGWLVLGIFEGWYLETVDAMYVWYPAYLLAGLVAVVVVGLAIGIGFWYRRQLK